MYLRQVPCILVLYTVNTYFVWFYPLVDLVIMLWKLEDFFWVWEMRACRSMGFDVCLVEIACVFWNRTLIWFIIFLVFVWIEKLDLLGKFWMPKMLYFKYFGCWVCSLLWCVSWENFLFGYPKKAENFFFLFSFLFLAGIIWIFASICHFLVFLWKEILGWNFEYPKNYKYYKRKILLKIYFNLF